MSVIEEALKAKLIADATILGLVSTRVYPGIIPQSGTMPCIMYRQIFGGRDHVMAGASGLVHSTYEIICVADTYAEAKSVSEAVRSELDGYNGTASGVVIQDISLIDEEDMPNIEDESEKLRKHRKQLTFTIWYKE